jgi:hypothetical protein
MQLVVTNNISTTSVAKDANDMRAVPHDEASRSLARAVQHRAPVMDARPDFSPRLLP